MDKPRLTKPVFEQLLTMRALANSALPSENLTQIERANEWLTSMSRWRQTPAGKHRKRRRVLGR